MSGDDKFLEAEGGDHAFQSSLDRVKGLLNGQDTPPAGQGLPADVVVFVVLRSGGRRLAEAWSSAKASKDPLSAAIAGAVARAASAERTDTVEVCFGFDIKPVKKDQVSKVFSNINRGRIGIQLTSGSNITRFAPTKMIATNRSFKKIIDDFTQEQANQKDGRARSVVLKQFQAESFLVPIQSDETPQRLFRGNRVVGQQEVSAQTVAALADRMSGWMLKNLHGNGRMTYKYWPSRGDESGANNMIRQWMASVALVRIADFTGDPETAERALLNVRYNLISFAARKDALEFILHENESKLGATALAALAISELPKGHDLQPVEQRMRNTVEHLWHANGAFTTFLIPTGENRNQNFYPGEALLYLAHKFASGAAPELLPRIMKSVEFYRSWHLENRNPAFVPWHVMAYELVWHQTQDQDLRDWIFEMSDWLTGLQVPDVKNNPDINGRFYDPKRSHFGRPHASATGVYLEGMIAAWRVAKAAGDPQRQERYRVSIVRGLRSLMQLEFTDELDMFYVSKRDRVRGGLRTTVYDNEIRVDNVQHGLMAILQIIRDFQEDDFRPPES